MTTPPDFRALLVELVASIDRINGGSLPSLLPPNWRDLDRARAAINTPPLAPIPVSERPMLRSDPFNDAQGRCWCGTTEFIDELGDKPVPYPCSWELREPCAQDDCLLPHWAIPLPGESE